MQQNKQSKVGILTFHYSNHNYGALLQTYASVVNLRKMGLEPIVVNLQPPKSYFKDVSLGRQLLNRIIPNTFEQFRTKYIPLTSKISDANELIQLNEVFDAFYVGSDQVWRPGFTNENLKHYFLDFATNDKLKVAYAVSFGVDKFDADNQTIDSLHQLIHRFNFVSVREKSGIDICKNVFNIDAVHVLDPTLLLDGNEYINALNIKSDLNTEKYIAYYQLSSVFQISKDALKIQSETGTTKIKNIYFKSVKIFGKNITWFNSITEWLSGIKNASFVVTDSYHCVIFSILFQKQFVCILNSNNGNTRLVSLLNELNLSDRIYTEISNSYKEPIDYNKVYAKLTILRKQSFAFLESAFV